MTGKYIVFSIPNSLQEVTYFRDVQAFSKSLLDTIPSTEIKWSDFIVFCFFSLMQCIKALDVYIGTKMLLEHRKLKINKVKSREIREGAKQI